MKYRINASNLVNSDEFVREAVDPVVNEILYSQNKRMILTGGRGIGKSTVLCSLEKRGLGCKEQTIYHHPDFAQSFAKEPNKTFDKKVLDYFSELQFSNTILFYIKRYYPIVFKKYFEKDLESIHSLLRELQNQVNNYPYEGKQVECKYGIKDLSAEILNRFRQITGIEKLNIAFAGFDRMNGSSEYSQKTYEKYFDLFDKVVLTTTDSNLDTKRLSNKGYELKTISYGTDKDVLAEIIGRRKTIIEDEEAFKYIFTRDFVLDELIKCDGNIDLSLESLGVIKRLFVDGQMPSVQKIREIVEKEKKEYSRRLALFQPRLYL